MRAMHVRILLLVLLAACPSAPARETRPPDPVQTPPATTDPGAPQDVDPTPPSTPPPNEAKKADGAACFEGGECASGTCEGQGCGTSTPGKCMPRARGCTRDLRTYCGCDGKTFQSSGSCPGRRYSAKEKCEGS
jgi:hypothetical protein